MVGDSLPATTVGDYFSSWLARKKPETASSTYSFYSGKADRFLGWLGDRADVELFSLSPADVLRFGTSEAERVKPSTVNHEIKFLRMVFEDAKRDGLIADNPAENIKLLKCGGERLRRPFTLSRQFYELMVHAGMAAPKPHRAAINGQGRNGKRSMSEISFHALRHTATSLMKNAGISSATVQDIIGHESAAISANYTHIDEQTKRAALSAIPDVFDGRQHLQTRPRR